MCTQAQYIRHRFQNVFKDAALVNAVGALVQMHARVVQGSEASADTQGGAYSTYQQVMKRQ